MGALRPRRSSPRGSTRSPTLLVAPVLDAVGDRRVVLTPSGVLAGVPWTLLPGFVGRPVTVAQSATSWLARRTTPLRTGDGRLRRRPAGRARRGRGRRRREGVAGRPGADRRRRRRAAAVSELADDGRRPARRRPRSALARRTRCSPVSSSSTGRGSATTSTGSGRCPDVVLLSACEVGRSTVRWGEELIGMTTAWLHAGARCVIASAAAVNDQAAYDVLVAVHQRLAAGRRPGRRAGRGGAGRLGRHRPGAVGLLRLTWPRVSGPGGRAPQRHQGDRSTARSHAMSVTTSPTRSTAVHVVQDPQPGQRADRAGRAPGSRCGSAAADSA